MTFVDLHLTPKLVKNLSSKLQWTTPTPVQKTVVPLALNGRDLMVQSVTGSGKTGAFAIPIIDRLLLRGKYKSTTCLIISPTRELAQQIFSVINQMIQQMQISCALIIGGTNDFHSQQILLQNEPDIIVATPGRLIDHITNSAINLANIEVLVLDEADKLLELGFMKELQAIINQLPKARQTLLFSATLNSNVEDLVTLSLQKPLRVCIDTIQVNKNIQQQFVFVKDNSFIYKFACMYHILQQNSGQKTIIFATNKHQVNQLFLHFQAKDVDTYKMSSELNQNQRSKVLSEFNEDPSGVMISTDLASRGLDIDDVQLIIQLNVPDYDDYIHRVGRTGRYQSKGLAITLGTKEEIKKLVEHLKKQVTMKELTLDPQQVNKYVEEFDSKEFRQQLRDMNQQLKQEEELKLTDEKLKRFDGGFESKEKRGWFLNPKERKAVQQVVKMTDSGEMDKSKAQTLMKQKQIRSEMLKSKNPKAPKKSEAHAQIRKLKHHVKNLKKEGDYEGRNMKMDARKIK